jgi:Integrase core domain
MATKANAANLRAPAAVASVLFDSVEQITAGRNHPITLRYFLVSTASTHALPFPIRCTIESWRTDYNVHRPHSSLGELTPNEFMRR